MNNMLRNHMLRYLIAAALLATLAACGNKGPLVKASQAGPVDAAAAPIDAGSPAPSDPTEVAPLEQIPAPPVTDPASATPPADDGGNG